VTENQHVFVVDDDIDIRDSMKMLLEGGGVQGQNLRVRSLFPGGYGAKTGLRRR
jgi:FixJ family two-component response regulator